MATRNRNLLRSSSSKYNDDYDYLFKLLLLGDSGAGKSSLLLRWAGDRYMQSYIATIGIDFKIKTIEVGGKKIRLQVWDTAGQERFRSITAQYFRGTHGILCCFDLTREDSFRQIPRWYNEIQIHKTSEPAVILVGCKSDLTSQIEISTEAAETMAKDYDMEYIETSSRQDTNVDAVFERIAALVLETEILENQSELSDSNSIDLGKKTKPTSSTKCAC